MDRQRLFTKMEISFLEILEMEKKLGKEKYTMKMEQFLRDNFLMMFQMDKDK